MCSYWMFLDYLFFFDHLFFMVTPPRKIGLQICFLQKKIFIIYNNSISSRVPSRKRNLFYPFL